MYELTYVIYDLIQKIRNYLLTNEFLRNILKIEERCNYGHHWRQRVSQASRE